MAAVLALFLAASAFQVFPAKAAPAHLPEGVELLQTADGSGDGAPAATDQAAPDGTPDAEQAAPDGASGADQAASSGDSGASDAAGEGDVSAEPPERVTPSSRGGVRSPDAAPSDAPAEAKESTGDRIAKVALQYVGYPYAWAGASPRTGFDCSGLTWYVYKEAGVSIPLHDLRGQVNAGPRVDMDKLLPGDLVFFQNTYEAGLSHDGIYIGNGQFVHAETYSTGVRVSNLSGGWVAHWYAASRPWQ